MKQTITIPLQNAYLVPHEENGFVFEVDTDDDDFMNRFVLRKENYICLKYLHKKNELCG